MAEDIPLPIRDHLAVLRRIWSDRAVPIAPKEETMISVAAATRRIAYAYERFRNTLEPEEEDILRRKAIYRILERRVRQDRVPLASATALVQELMRAHYIPPVPQTYASLVARDIERAQQIITALDPAYQDWFLRLVAVSIDRKFHSHEEADALARLFYHDTYQRAVWQDELVRKTEQPAQLFVACYRALFAVDDYEIQYTYFINRFPAWRSLEITDEELTAVVHGLPQFYTFVQPIVHHEARYRLMRLLKPAAVPYRVLWSLLPTPDAWAGPSALEAGTRSAITADMQHIRARISRRAWHSILFLFFTKTFLALIIELPYELYLLGKVAWLALGTNIAFHPLLLFFTSTWVRLPGTRNTEAIVDQVKKIITGQGELPTIILSAPRRYGPITWSLFALIYALLFAGIFAGMFSILNRLEFSLVAMFFFIVFLGLVSFLSVRIRRSIDDIRLIPVREGALGAIVTFISLPILEFGRWLTRNITQLNVILFLMDRVLEAPFKLLIDVIEEWFSFVRDRKEEIV